MTDVHRTHPIDASPTERPLTMRALVHDRYGTPDVLEVRDAPVPTPAAGEVLVRVSAASVNPLDWHFTVGRPYFMRLLFGLRRPRQAVRGADAAGRVVAIGDGVTALTVGDRVAGVATGSFAEYAVAKATSIAIVPAAITDADAAAMPIAAVTALQAVRDHGGVRSGHRVLVIGAAGGVGVYAVQLAVAMGAEVTGVCSTRNVDLVRALGATEVVDYTTTDWPTAAGDIRYDVIIDNVGTHPLAACRRALTADGVYVMIGGPKHNPWLDPLARVVAGKIRFAFRSRRFAQFTAAARTADLEQLWHHVLAGELRPVVDEHIGLDGVASAIARFGTGHARGKTVVDIAPATGESRPDAAGTAS